MQPISTRSGTGPVRSISMVLPAYNEEANIALAVESADHALAQTGLECELIVVNDGSRDHTGELLRELALRFPRLRIVEHFPNRGYGGALRAGFAAASLDWIFQSDADNQFDYTELTRLIAAADSCDVVVGYRQPRRDPVARRLNGWAWNRLIRVLFGYVVRDIDCAFRLVRRSVLRSVPLTSDGAMVSTELLAGIKAEGFAIHEVRVSHLPRNGGEPTGANMRVIGRALRDLVRYRVTLTRRMSERAAALPAVLHESGAAD